MEGSTFSIPTHATIPLTEVVRARITDARVPLPVQGSIYARLEHISAVPSHGRGGGYSFSRLQAIDAMLARIENLRKAATPDVAQDPVEQTQAIIEEAARRIAEDIEGGGNGFGFDRGFLLDMTA
ncbi:MAG: hypothetical protein ACLFR8_12055 [Alkalispirochaeta sp.]